MRRIPTQIIDAHHHLWDLSAIHYPWLSETGVHRFFGDPGPIQKNYLFSDYKADFTGLPIVKSVHIQVGAQDGDAVIETAWLQACAEKNQYPHGIVAYCDMTAVGFEASLESQQDFKNLRGVRQIVGRNAAEDARNGTNELLESFEFKSGLKYLAKQGLSFDLQLTPPLLQSAARLFEAIEGLPVAICHAGSLSDFSKEGVALWRAGLERFAKSENVICKISGFGMFDHNWSVETIRGRVLQVIDIFGPDRVAFGSNFPVDKLYATYSNTMMAYLEITEGFTDEERRFMFHDVAERFYKL